MMGGRGAKIGGPEKLTQDDYLRRRGLHAPFSDYMIDKMRSNKAIRTQRGQERFLKEADRVADKYQEDRAAAIGEYKRLVAEGKVVQPTALEERLRTAQGHDDNLSVQAARRRLEKQGIDWRTGKKLR